MIVTSDFECGNGKDIQQIGERRFRVTEYGDRVTYCYYFLFEMKTEGPEDAGEWTVEIVGDPDLAPFKDIEDVGTHGLMNHTPCTVWVSRWERWRPLGADRIEYADDRIIVRVTVPEQHPVRVTNVIPAYYSETTALLKKWAARMPENAEYIEIGQGTEGRPIAGLRVTEGLKTGERPRFVVFSGQHPIEFPGIFGSRGIADFLTTHIAEAEALRSKYDFVVLPMVNPDGTVLGRNNFNAKGEDVLAAFEGAAAGAEVTVKESAALWDFCQDPPPALLLNIHCYCSLGAFIEWPYNGFYVMTDEAFADDATRRRQRIVDDHIRFGTTGLTGHSDPWELGSHGIGPQLCLKYGTLGNLFEINASTHGPTGAAREALNCLRAMIAGYEAACEV